MSYPNSTIVKEIAEDVEGSVLATLITMAHAHAAMISILLERKLITELDATKILAPLEKALKEEPTPFGAQRIARIMMSGIAMEIRDQVRWPED